jgi:hypothetical protein
VCNSFLSKYKVLTLKNEYMICVDISFEGQGVNLELIPTELN